MLLVKISLQKNHCQENHHKLESKFNIYAKHFIPLFNFLSHWFKFYNKSSMDPTSLTYKPSLWSYIALRSNIRVSLYGFIFILTMSLLHKLPDNLNKALIYQRISAGQAISFPWDKTSTKTRNLVQAYSNSLGCPDEYIFFPLLTVAASFIGTNGTMQINESWEEPAIAWFNVCARKGQKKNLRPSTSLRSLSGKFKKRCRTISKKRT